MVESLGHSFEILPTPRDGVVILLTLISERVVKAVSKSRWVRRWRIERASKELFDAPDHFRDGVYHWHGLQIPGIQGLMLRPDAVTALTERQLRCTFRDEPRALSEEARAWVQGPLAERIAARKRAAIYHNDACFSLDAFEVGRGPQSEGRPTQLELRMSPTDYETFVSYNLMLDEPIAEGPASPPQTLRDRMRVPRSGIRSDDLRALPIHTKVGTSTLAITRDQLMVLTARPSRMMVAPGGDRPGLSVLAVGEGMVREDSLRAGFGLAPAPFATVRRALDRELRITEDDYGHDGIRLLGLCFDHQRMQPLLVFAVQLRLSATELRGKWPFAADAQEHEQLAFVDCTPEAVRDLLVDGRATDRDSGRTVSMASNQGMMTVFLGSLFFLGHRAMRAVLHH